MNERIKRLQAELLEVASDWHDGCLAEDEYLCRSILMADGTLELLCEDNAPQGDLDYVANMILAPLLAEHKRAGC